MKNPHNIEHVIDDLLDETIKSYREERQHVFEGPPTVCITCGKLFPGRKSVKNIGPVLHCSVQCRAWCCLYEYEQTGVFHPVVSSGLPAHNAYYTYLVIAWVLLEAEKPLHNLEVMRRIRRLGGTRNEALRIIERLWSHGYLSGGDRRMGGKNHFVLTGKGRGRLSKIASPEGLQMGASLMEISDEWYLRLIEDGHSATVIKKMISGVSMRRTNPRLLTRWGLLIKNSSSILELTPKAKERLKRRDEVWQFLKKNDLNPSGLTFPL